VRSFNSPGACLLPESRCATELLPQTCLSANLQSNRRFHPSGLLWGLFRGLRPFPFSKSCLWRLSDFRRHPPPAGPAADIRLSSGSDPPATLPARAPAFAVSVASGAFDASALFPRLLCLPARLPAGSRACACSHSQGRRGGEPPASLNRCIPPAAPSTRLPDCSFHLVSDVTAGDSRITETF